MFNHFQRFNVQLSFCCWQIHVHRLVAIHHCAHTNTRNATVALLRTWTTTSISGVHDTIWNYSLKKEVHRESCKRADLWTKMVARTTGLQWLGNPEKQSPSFREWNTDYHQRIQVSMYLIRSYKAVSGGGNSLAIGLTYCLHGCFVPPFEVPEFLGETHPCERPRATTQNVTKMPRGWGLKPKKISRDPIGLTKKKTWHREMEGFINSACGFHPFFLVALWCFLDVAFSLKKPTSGQSRLDSNMSSG